MRAKSDPVKRIGLTQRVEMIVDYGERRDSLDQRWYSLLLSMNMLPIPLPNIQATLAASLVENLRLDGVILTGGNSLYDFDDTAANQALDRDRFELSLIDYAVKNKLPMFGVCRGMQIINKYFGGTLVPISGHVAKNHPIVQVIDTVPLPKKVNSFHEWAIPFNGLGRELKPIASDLDGNIEAYTHLNKRVGGVMWHPERDEQFDSLNINFLIEILS